MLRYSKRIAPIAAAVLVMGLYATPAAAQATRTWVSGVGDDANPCSRTAPCKTFAGTISKTAAGGEINCIDPAGYGQVSITKSISIICDDTEAGILVSNTSGIVINSTTANVTISGLDLDGFGNGGGVSTNGVNVVNAAAVHIRNTKIRGFKSLGINFQPQNANSQLFVDNVVLNENGTSGNGVTGGIFLNPAAGFTATATITNTHLSNNQNFGVRVDTTGIVGSVINATIDNAVISNNGVGILVKAPNATGTAKFMLTNSQLNNNASQGIILNGTTTSANARVGNTTITNNGQGIMILGAAELKSYGDNRLDGNATDGAFSGTVLPKK